MLRFSCQGPARVVLGGTCDCLVLAGDCSCDWAGASGPVAAWAFGCLELMTETTIKNPKRETIAVDRSFMLVLESNVSRGDALC